MLQITINGEARTLADKPSLAELLDRLGYDRTRVAVEVNQAVVPRKTHPEHYLNTGDAVEIVTLVGGGAP
ncbi:MAG TPA: sulfur carrier protein ThiS, partial [Gemmataceae bacterium]|nr:sulfur carrier protein ThiS [Gemmataceae bacterium]